MKSTNPDLPQSEPSAILWKSGIADEDRTKIRKHIQNVAFQTSVGPLFKRVCTPQEREPHPEFGQTSNLVQLLQLTLSPVLANNLLEADILNRLGFRVMNATRYKDLLPIDRNIYAREICHHILYNLGDINKWKWLDSSIEQVKNELQDFPEYSRFGDACRNPFEKCANEKHVCQTRNPWHKWANLKENTGIVIEYKKNNSDKRYLLSAKVKEVRVVDSKDDVEITFDLEVIGAQSTKASLRYSQRMTGPERLLLIVRSKCLQQTYAVTEVFYSEGMSRRLTIDPFCKAVDRSMDLPKFRGSKREQEKD